MTFCTMENQSLFCNKIAACTVAPPGPASPKLQDQAGSRAGVHCVERDLDYFRF